MAPLSPRILIGALALTPLTSAWTLVWRNSTAGATIINENKPENCTQIWHQQGEPFSWDPEGKWCMHFYKDTACTQIAGYACDGKVWRKDASRNLSAFDVYPMPPESVSVIYPSTSSKSTTSSASKTPTSSAVTTTAAQSQSATSAAASTTPTETPISSSSSSSLTGGAIAGIVIGAIAALAALAALFFFFGRRNRKPAPPDTKPGATATSPQSPQFPPGSPLGLVSTNDTASAGAAPAYIVPHKQELAETEMSQPQAHPHLHGHPYPRAYASSKYVELPGNGGEAELSNSRQVHEMDGTSDVKRPIYEAA